MLPSNMGNISHHTVLKKIGIRFRKFFFFQIIDKMYKMQIRVPLDYENYNVFVEFHA